MIDTELTPALPQDRFTLTRRRFITGLIFAGLKGCSHSAIARENFSVLPQISLHSATDEDKPVFNKDASSSESLINYDERVELGKVEGNWANEIDVGQDGFVFTSTLDGENRDSTVLTFGHFDSNPDSFTKKGELRLATPYTSVVAGKKALFIGEYDLTSPQGSAFQLSTVDKITHEKRTIDVSKFDESNLEVSTIAPHVHLSVLMLPDSNGCTKSEALVYAQQYISNYGDPTGTDNRFQTLRVVVHNTETGEQQKIFAEIESNSGRPFDFDQTTITEVVHHENDILVICRNGVWRLKNENTQYTTSFEPFMYVPNGTATAAFDKKTGQLFFANTSGNGDIVAGKLTYDPHEKSWTPNVSTKVLRKSDTDGWHGVVGGDTYARSLIVTPDEDHDARILFVPCAWLNKPPFDGNAHFGILQEPILFQDGDFSRATNRTFNKRRYELLARQAPGGILMLETDEINQANLTLAFYPTKQPRNLVESNVNRCQAILPRVQNRDSDPTN